MEKFLTSYIDFFVHFFAICRELVKKIIYLKRVGVTDHPSELNLSKVNATDTITSRNRFLPLRARSCMT